MWEVGEDRSLGGLDGLRLQSRTMCKQVQDIQRDHGRTWYGFINLDKARKQQVQVTALDVKSLSFWSLRWGSSIHYNMATSHTEPESYLFLFTGF